MTPEEYGHLIAGKWISMLAGLAVVVTALITIRKGFMTFEKPAKSFKERVLGTAKINRSIESMRLETKNQITAISNSIQQGFTTFGTTLSDIQKNQARIVARQRTMMNAVGFYSFETDEAGLWTMINKPFCQLTGRSSNDLIGNGWLNSVAHNDRERVAHEYSDAIDDERTVEIEMSIISVSGNHIPVTMRTQKMECSDKKMFGYFGTITEKKQVG